MDDGNPQNPKTPDFDGRAQAILPDGWPRPQGYANGMRARGTLLAVSGQIGWDATGRLATGFAAQFAQALANLVTVVRAGGGAVEDIISMTVYVTDREEYVAARVDVGAAWKRLMGRHYPAMALVVVAALLEPAARVEMQALAVVADRVE